MTCSPIKIAARCVGCCIALASVTALLSLVFNFLGTILCAALAGMMMGASKRNRWSCLPVSCVFPAVIFILFRVTGTEMPDSQVWIVNVICFGTFWLLYGATALVVAYERSQKAGAINPERPLADPGMQARSDRGADVLPVAAQEARPQPLEGLCLGLLQGKWSCFANGQPGANQKKILLIEQEHLALSFDDPQGQGRLLLNGAVRVESATNPPARILTVNPFEVTADTLISI